MPASRPGEPGLVRVSLITESLRVTTSGFQSEYDAVNALVTQSCSFATAPLFFNPVNAPAGSPGIPLAGYSASSFNDAGTGSTGTSGPVNSEISPVRIGAQFFAEIPCLFIAVAENNSNRLMVEINDYLLNGQVVSLQLGNAVAGTFSLLTDFAGEIRVEAEFFPEALNWSVNNPPGP